MIIIKDIAQIIEFVLFAYLAFNSAYLFIFGMAGVFSYGPKPAPGKVNRKIAVLVPGYKEDNVILETARESMKQDYPQELFDVYIIADSFRPETIQQLRELDVRVIEVSFDLSSKAKALNRAMQEIRDEYQVAVILDADNIMAPGFLTQVNDAFNRGFTAVQGHRVAKNINTRFAVLDAISEEINNNIFRKGHRVLGLSSALIGSGMAFDYAFYKETMSEVTSHGEDKELEMKILMDQIKIEYLPNALVYDEKIQKAEVFAKQRKRWLSAQFGMFRKYSATGLKQLFTRGNIDLFDKVVQMMLPPRVLHAGIVTVLFLSALLILIISGQDLWPAVPVVLYGGLWFITLTALLVSIPLKFYNRKTLQALKTLPGAFMIMFSLLFKLRGADKTFIHTPHGTVESKIISENHENRH